VRGGFEPEGVSVFDIAFFFEAPSRSHAEASARSAATPNKTATRRALNFSLSLGRMTFELPPSSASRILHEGAAQAHGRAPSPEVINESGSVLTGG
jgi:hypothetical protein